MLDQQRGDETAWRDGSPPEPWLDVNADQTRVQYGRDGFRCDAPRDADEARLWLGYADGGFCVAAYQCDHGGQWVLTGSDLGMAADEVARAESFGSAKDAVRFPRQRCRRPGWPIGASSGPAHAGGTQARGDAVISTDLAADGEVIWSDTRSMDVGHAARLVFGRLVRLAAPVIRRYESDLFHDAMWLRTHLAGMVFTFFWSVGEWGTHIGTDEALAHQAARTLHHTGLYRVTVALDGRNRTVLAVSPPPAQHRGASSDG